MSLAPDRRAALDGSLAADPEWQAMLRHFDLSNGFSFVVLLVDSRENAELCREALAAHLDLRDAGSIELVAPETPEEFSQLPSQIRYAQPENGVRVLWVEAVVTEGDPAYDKWRLAWRRCFAAINPFRNILQRDLKCALVFAGAPWVQVAIREAAPDLWSIRSSVTRVALTVQSEFSAQPSRSLEQPPALFDPETSDAPDPEFARQMAESLRCVPGKEVELAKLLARAGIGFFERWQNDRALVTLEEAYALLEEHAPDTIDMANCASWLGKALQRAGRFEAAEPMLRRALAINEMSYGPDHPYVAIDLNNLAQLLHDTNRLAEAEPMMRRALAIDEKSYGPDHPNVAIRLNNLAQLLQDTNRLAEAEPMIRRALAIDEKSYGPDHPKVAIRLNNLAQLLKATNRLAEAEPMMRRALAIDEMSYGPEHPEVAINLNNLALLLQDTNRLAEAEPMMRRALAIDEKSYGPDHPDVAIRLNNLALLLDQTNRADEAEPLARRCLEIFKLFQRNTGYEHRYFSQDRENYEAILRDIGLSEGEIAERMKPFQ